MKEDTLLLWTVDDLSVYSYIDQMFPRNAVLSFTSFYRVLFEIYEKLYTLVSLGVIPDINRSCGKYKDLRIYHSFAAKIVTLNFIIIVPLTKIQP